jgi:tRNA-uridine 2-sulfurtransferase
MMVKAAALLSGGLDSLLATKVIIDQGIEVEGLCFDIGFSSKENPAGPIAKQLGIKLHNIEVIDKYRDDVLLKPKHGYGANLNPCLDCKIFMVKQALVWIKQNNFDFIITGEVIGQRPMSQLSNKMPIVAKQSGALELLLRPLCAKLLPPTLPEINGWVKREELFGFNGRSRKPQFALAAKLGFKKFPQPAGGCLLTDENFCKRLLDLWQFRSEKNYSREDLELLKIGRHLYPKADLRMIISRNDNDNTILQKYCDRFANLICISHKGPITLLEGELNPENLELAARITARFSQGKNAEEVTVQIALNHQPSYKTTVIPLPANEIPANWYK